MAPRTLKLAHASVRDDVTDPSATAAAPLISRRALPGEDFEHLDPFLLLNHHGPQALPPKKTLPFQPQPHRGFDIVTLVLDGALTHKTSGHSGPDELDAGGGLWVTVGRGALHGLQAQRKLVERGGDVEILQLWLNLPSRWKMSPPKTVTKQRKDLPGFRGRGVNSNATCTPISGDWFNDFGPFEPITDVALALVDIDAGGRFEVAVDAGKVAIVYVVRGSVVVGESDVAEFSVVEFNDDGDSVTVESKGGARVLVGHGSATGEPVVSVGPFVMNTEEEIRQAIFDARSGRIGR